MFVISDSVKSHFLTSYRSTLVGYVKKDMLNVFYISRDTMETTRGSPEHFTVNRLGVPL